MMRWIDLGVDLREPLRVILPTLHLIALINIEEWFDIVIGVTFVLTIDLGCALASLALLAVSATR